MRNIPDWELQAWENATKYGKKVVVKLFEPFKDPVIKTNIDFFEAMRLTKGFTIVQSEESAHKITFEYDKEDEDEVQDTLKSLQEHSTQMLYEMGMKAKYYALDQRSFPHFEGSYFSTIEILSLSIFCLIVINLSDFSWS